MGNRYSSSVPPLFQTNNWCSLLVRLAKPRLRSISLTSAWMPIFFHCSAIISAICGTAGTPRS